MRHLTHPCIPTHLHAHRQRQHQHSPDQAFVVEGNAQINGRLLCSTAMPRTALRCDTTKQLDNVRKLALYQSETESGMIGPAEAYQLMPDAFEALNSDASPASDSRNGSADPLPSLMSKDRFFIEGLGAIQELATLADSLAKRVKVLEQAIQATGAVPYTSLPIPAAPETDTNTSSGKNNSPVEFDQKP